MVWNVISILRAVYWITDFIFLIIKTIETLQTSVTDLRRHIDEIVRRTDVVAQERHTEILKRLDILPDIEQGVEQIRLQPLPHAHFSPEAQAILMQELGVDVNRMDFTDPITGGSLFAVKFNTDNINLFGTTIGK